jgi:signal transduction histidine kinase
MLDNIRDSVILVDSKGEILLMNRASQNRYGNQVNRVCHQSIFAQHDPCPICQVVKLVKQGKEKVEMEIGDQQGNYLSLSAYPFLDGTGNGRFIVYIRDITQRRKWEEESAFLDKFASLGYLSSGIAHELNNNLTPILICAQMLGQADLPQSVREKAQKIETCATDSKRLVESLTDFAQQIPHHKAFTDLNTTLQRTLDLMEYRLSSAGIKVKLNLDQDLPSILVDELKIQQVFSNLITNAYQALQPKGGEISITTTHSQGWCKIEIADSGPGIAPDIRSKIFDPFFTTRQFGEGKGLGLSTSFGIVSAHQGKLHFRTKEQVGTTFVIELPVAAAWDTSFIPSVAQAGLVPAESLF